MGGIAVAGSRGGEHGESSGPAGRPGSPLMARQQGLPDGGHDLVAVNIIFSSRTLASALLDFAFSVCEVRFRIFNNRKKSPRCFIHSLIHF